MTPEEWQHRFIEVSHELAYLAADVSDGGDEATAHEGALLEELDSLELTAAAMVRSGTAYN